MRAFIGLAILCLVLTGCEKARENSHPICVVRAPTILMAESVKSASMIPCVVALPVGWRFAGFTAEDGRSSFALDSEAGGEDALLVILTADCRDAARAGVAIHGDEPGTDVTQQIRSEDPYEAVRALRFDGGCAVYEMRFASGAPVEHLVADVGRAISFIERQEIDRGIHGELGLDPAGV
jgi:hypothetical protein